MSTDPSAIPVPEPIEGDGEKAFAAAKRRAEDLQGLYIHLTVYAIVNGFLLAINGLTRGEDGAWWVPWVMALWGIELVIHLTAVLGVFSPDWAERKARASLRGTRG